MDFASKPAVNLHISSTCADGRIGATEIRIGQAFGAKDDEAAEEHLKELAKTRPLAAIVHCQREIVSRGGDRDTAALVAVRSELLTSYSDGNALGGVFAMALCAASSPDGTTAELEAANQLHHGLSALGATGLEQSFFPALLKSSGNVIAKAIENPRQNAIEFQQPDTARLRSIVFLPLAPEQPIIANGFIGPRQTASFNRSRFNAAQANEVLAVFLGQEDGPKHVEARRALTPRPAGPAFAGNRPGVSKPAISVSPV